MSEPVADESQVVLGPLVTVGAVLAVAAWRRRSARLTFIAGVLIGLGVKVRT